MRTLLAAFLVGCAADTSQSTPWRPESLFACAARLDILGPDDNDELTTTPDGVPETGLEYEVVRYTNGDSDASCSAAIGWEQGGSDSSYYPAPTLGAKLRACTAASNYPGGLDLAGGGWDFSAAGWPAATYRDPDNPFGLDGKSYTFAEGDCTAALMNKDGSWARSTLDLVL